MALTVSEGINSNDVNKHAYGRYNLSLSIGLAKVAGKAFRIGHLGDLNELMVLATLSVTEMSLLDAGVKVDLGSGIAAAQAYLRETAKAL